MKCSCIILYRQHIVWEYLISKKRGYCNAGLCLYVCLSVYLCVSIPISHYYFIKCRPIVYKTLYEGSQGTYQWRIQVLRLGGGGALF